MFRSKLRCEVKQITDTLMGAKNPHRYLFLKKADACYLATHPANSLDFSVGFSILAGRGFSRESVATFLRSLMTSFHA